MITIGNIKLRIIDRRRFTAFAMIVFILFSTLAITFTGQVQVKGQSVTNYAFVHIIEGDTLWDIAKQYNQDNEDIRKVVNDIMTENSLKTAMLSQGQVIKVPIK